jgi:hypothetical protein
MKHLPAGLLPNEELCEQKVDVSPDVENGNLQLELEIEPLVVGVEKGDELAASGIDGAVARDSRASMGLTHDPDCIAETGQNSRGLIVGFIVNDKDFPMRIGLAEDAANGITNHRGAVKRGDDDADKHRSPYWRDHNSVGQW